MNIVTHKQEVESYGSMELRKTWVVGMDVHEIPDLMDLKVPARNKAKRANLDRSWIGEGTIKKSFYLGRLKSLESLEKLHHKGWADGSKKAMALATGLMEKVVEPVGIRRRIRWGDDGDEFDRERMLDGHLETAWRTSARALAVATPIINIAVGWGGNCDLSHEQLFWSGASALALIRILENAGYQTSLTAICANDMHSNDEHIAICARIKQAGEYLRSDAVASIICHGATFRTYLFAGYCASPFTMPSGLGHNCSVDRVIPAAIASGILEVPQVVLPDSYDEPAAKRSIENALEELQAANLAALPELGR
jgi:hypothetical protein